MRGMSQRKRNPHCQSVIPVTKKSVLQILVLEVVDSEDVVVVEEVLGFVVVVDQVVEVLVVVVDVVEMDCGKQKVIQKSNQLKGVDSMD